MATKKKLLQAAAGTAAASGGAGGLNVEDVFSTYVYEGNGGTQVIENGINLGQSNGSGSIGFDNGDGLSVSSTISLSGDFTIEAWVWRESTSYSVIIGSPTTSPNNQFGVNNSNVLYAYTGAEYNSTSTVPSSEWVHVAFSRSGSTLYFFINGAASGSSTVSDTFSLQQIGLTDTQYNKWIGYISDLRVVSGSALYTSSFTAPTAPLTAVTGTQLLTGQGDSPLVDNSSNNYTLSNINSPKASTFGPFDAAEAGEGGLVWIKNRDDTGSNHVLFDTERPLISGDIAKIYSNLTNGQDANADDFEAFNANGFSLNGTYNVNSSSYDYASWTFRKAPKFFDCVTWSGDGTAGRTISHNLGTTVGFIIVKRTDAVADWRIWARQDASNAQALTFSTSAGVSPQANVWGDGTSHVAPTSTEFTIGDYHGVNASGGTYVAYLFAHNDGDGDFGPDGDADIIKCGSYTGNGSTDGPEIDLGFEPQFILQKSTSTTGSWRMWDSMRHLGIGNRDGLFPNSSSAEDTFNNTQVNVTPTGFKVTSTNAQINGNGGNHIYIAIRRGPMAVPTDATEVFAIDTLDSTGSGFDSNFVVDMAFERNVSSASDTRIASRLTGATALRTNTTEAEGAQSSNVFDFMDGWFYDGSSNSSKYSWMWKRAPNYFDAVAYTGTGSTRTVSHNLGVAPEMMWVKRRNSTGGDWAVYHKDTGNTDYMYLNSTAASVNSDNYWNYTSPTDTEFTVKNTYRTNASGDNYIAYLFASLDGVSKVGSYTATGSDQNIDCGFSSGARFVLIKGTSLASAWVVIDTERGLVTGNDPWLRLDSNTAENSSYDMIDPYSSGFTVTGSNANVNSSGATYIFYAIA